MEPTQETAPRILAVDDNPEIREIIRVLLSGEGYTVLEAGSGPAALEALGKGAFDLIILDIMMPGMNGYETCGRIREMSNAPILFLSARTTDSDKLLGFSSGGDDYLAKPFSYSELLGRAKALIRRYHIYQGKSSAETVPNRGVVSYHELQIDLERETVLRAGAPVELTDTEFAMLKLMVTNRRQVFSAQRLYEAVWNEPYYYGASNTVMVHIRNLRRKIEQDPQNPLLIKTTWGKGYHCD